MLRGGHAHRTAATVPDAPHVPDGKKIVPPPPVVAEETSKWLADHMRRIITDRVLAEPRIDEQVAEALRNVTVPAGEELVDGLDGWLEANPDQHWTHYINNVARDLAERPQPSSPSPGRTCSS